jgi:hypothetical protein
MHGDPYDRIARVLDRRIRNGLASHVTLAMPCEGFHQCTLSEVTNCFYNKAAVRVLLHIRGSSLQFAIKRICPKAPESDPQENGGQEN